MMSCMTVKIVQLSVIGHGVPGGQALGDPQRAFHRVEGGDQVEGGGDGGGAGAETAFLRIDGQLVRLDLGGAQGDGAGDVALEFAERRQQRIPRRRW